MRTTKPKTSSTGVEIISTLRRRVKTLRKAARELEALLKNIPEAKKGKWKSVHEIEKLVPKKAYLIRRTWRNGKKGQAAIYIWDLAGWGWTPALPGQSIESGFQGAGLEIWVSTG
jgi:hypothetical protein